MSEEKKNRNSQAKIKANNRYVEETYERITVRIPKGSKESLKAKIYPDSLNGFITKAVEEKLNGKKIVPDLEVYAKSAGLSPEEYIKQAVLEKMKRQDDSFTETVKREKLSF